MFELVLNTPLMLASLKLVSWVSHKWLKVENKVTSSVSFPCKYNREVFDFYLELCCMAKGVPVGYSSALTLSDMVRLICVIFNSLRIRSQIFLNF